MHHHCRSARSSQQKERSSRVSLTNSRLIIRINNLSRCSRRRRKTRCHIRGLHGLGVVLHLEPPQTTRALIVNRSRYILVRQYCRSLPRQRMRAPRLPPPCIRISMLCWHSCTWSVCLLACALLGMRVTTHQLWMMMRTCDRFVAFCSGEPRLCWTLLILSCRAGQLTMHKRLSCKFFRCG